MNRNYLKCILSFEKEKKLRKFTCENNISHGKYGFEML